jgi:uncharacterized phage infection (PIP) family protein YhgE
MEEVNNAAAENSQSKTSPARNMERTTTAEKSNNMDEGGEDEASTESNMNEDVVTLNGWDLLGSSRWMPKTSAAPSHNSNSPAAPIPTSTKGKEKMQTESSNTNEGSSLISSMLSLIETGVENERTLALYENRAEDMQDYITGITDQIESMGRMRHRILPRIAVSDPTPSLS